MPHGKLNAPIVELDVQPVYPGDSRVGQLSMFVLSRDSALRGYGLSLAAYYESMVLRVVSFSPRRAGVSPVKALGSS